MLPDAAVLLSFVYERCLGVSLHVTCKILSVRVMQQQQSASWRTLTGAKLQRQALLDQIVQMAAGKLVDGV